MSHSLQCPKCHGVVTAADQSGGSRVHCPHCEHVFVVPGIAPADRDDDDWLSLDDDLPPVGASTGDGNRPASGEAVTRPSGGTAGTTGGVGPPLADEDPFAEDGPADQGAALPDDEADGFLDDLPPLSPPPRRAPSAAAPVATSVEYETEYRVRCNVCGTSQYAQAKNAGKTLTCPDCHSPMTIPPPPKRPKKPTVDANAGDDLRFSEAAPERRSDDPWRKSAEQLLDEASRTDDEEEPETYYDVPKIRDWARTVFSIFTQPAVTVHWIVLSLVASVASYLALASEMQILVVGLFPFGLLFAAIVVACGFAILQSIANGEREVTEWPLMADPTEWFGTLLVAVSAAVLAGVPAWAVGQFFFGPNLAAVCLTMLAIYALFPFILLSMLDMQSVFVPFSGDVARSVTQCEESWGGFYFSSGLLFFALFLIYVIGSLMTPASASVLYLFATVGVSFVYFSMLGRLAYAIGQTVNAPPLENDIDRTRRSESR